MISADQLERLARADARAAARQLGQDIEAPTAPCRTRPIADAATKVGIIATATDEPLADAGIELYVPPPIRAPRPVNLAPRGVDTSHLVCRVGSFIAIYCRATAPFALFDIRQYSGRPPTWSTVATAIPDFRDALSAARVICGHPQIVAAHECDDDGPQPVDNPSAGWRLPANRKHQEK